MSFFNIIGVYKKACFREPGHYFICMVKSYGCASGRFKHYAKHWVYDIHRAIEMSSPREFIFDPCVL